MTDFTTENLAKLLNNWGQSGDWDLNKDGVVDSQDLSILLNSMPIAGAEAQAMARWNFVPHQIKSSPTNSMSVL